VLTNNSEIKPSDPFDPFELEFFEDAVGDRYEYVSDSDVEEYLRGILWNLQMYSEGLCPDVSYTYVDRMAPSPPRIIRFLRAHTDDMLAGKHPSAVEPRNFDLEEIEWLKQTIAVPSSNVSYLSPEATSACIIPAESRAFVSADMREVWRQMDFLLSPLSNKNICERLSYGHLIEKLTNVWSSVGSDLTVEKKVSSRIDPVFRSRNQRRIPRSTRKEKGREKYVSKMSSFSVFEKEEDADVEDFYSRKNISQINTRYKSVMISEADKKWTVLMPNSGRKNLSYILTGNRLSCFLRLSIFHFLVTFYLS